MPGPPACEPKKQAPRHAYLTSVPVGWNSLLDHVEQALGPRSPVALSSLRDAFLRIRDRTFLGFLLLLHVLFCLINLNQRRPSVCRLVQGLCYSRGLRVVLRIVLVNLRLFCRTFRLTLPVAAELV